MLLWKGLIFFNIREGKNNKKKSWTTGAKQHDLYVLVVPLGTIR